MTLLNTGIGELVSFRQMTARNKQEFISSLFEKHLGLLVVRHVTQRTWQFILARVFAKLKGYEWNYDHLGIIFKAVSTDGNECLFYTDYSDRGAVVYAEFDYETLLDGIFIVPDTDGYVVPLIGYVNSMANTGLSQSWFDWILWFIFDKPMLDCVSYVYVALSMVFYDTPEYFNDTPLKYLKRLEKACHEKN